MRYTRQCCYPAGQRRSYADHKQEVEIPLHDVGHERCQAMIVKPEAYQSRADRSAGVVEGAARLQVCRAAENSNLLRISCRFQDWRYAKMSRFKIEGLRNG